jgi:hypothetical protein
MNDDREHDEFRRIAIMARIERAQGFITRYREHIDYYRDHIDSYGRVLGHIAERLGEPEPEVPR